MGFGKGLQEPSGKTIMGRASKNIGGGAETLGITIHPEVNKPEAATMVFLLKSMCPACFK
jgi:hypothetical protein